MTDPNFGVENTPPQSFGRLTVSEAALQLRLSYQQTQNLVLKGQIEGGKDEEGWYVEKDSLARYLSEQGAA